MRILHFFDHSIPLHSGYAFRSQAILEQQRAFGWETFHLTGPKHHQDSPEKETVEELDFFRTAAPLPFWTALPGLREFALMWASKIRLDQVIQTVKPDILHAHSPVLNALPALWVGRRWNLPVVYEVRAFWEDAAASHGTGREGGPRYRLVKSLESFAVKNAAAVTTICHGLRDDLIGRGLSPHKVTVVPNAVDLNQFDGDALKDEELAKALGLDGKVVLGFFGSFYAYEGLEFLLKALPSLVRKLPEVCLLLVGGGPEEANLKALTVHLNIESKVVFTGRVPHELVGRYYGLVDILIYPRLSIRLTELVTPLKPLEAMAQRKIIVASNVGGHRELLGFGKFGTLFKAGDKDDLVAKLAEVMKNRGGWTAQVERGRRFVESEGNWEKSVGLYKEVYAHVLETNKYTVETDSRKTPIG